MIRTGEAVIIDYGCFSGEEERRLQDFLLAKEVETRGFVGYSFAYRSYLRDNFIKNTYGLSAQASDEDNFLVENAVEYAAMLGVTGITPPPAVGKFLKDGDRVRFGESELEVIAVGGHSPGGLCYYSSADRLLIAGDVLFAGSVGRSDLPGGNARVLIEGIRRKLLCLPDEVKVIPGHGPATTIGEEKRYNPFLN